MTKKNEPIKCEKCGLEFPDSVLSEEHKNKAFIWDDKILCKDCLILAGGNPVVANNLWDYNYNEEKAKHHDW